MEENIVQHKGIDLEIENNAGDQVKNHNDKLDTRQEEIQIY